ncbi:MAG: polymer-forming cytoskeletal protein [Candidatus Eisenbacteria bacterium]
MRTRSSRRWSLLGLALVLATALVPAPLLAMQMTGSVGSTLVGLSGLKVDMSGMDVDEKEGLCLGGGNMCFAQTSNYFIPVDKVEERDLYLWSQMLELDGVLDGDLIAWVQSGRLGGTVTQDVAMFAQDMRITGKVEDDLRIFCQNLYIDGTIKGDVLALAANITLSEGAVIEGNVLAAGGMSFLNGDVMGDVTIAGGTVTVNGTIGGNAELLTDGGLSLGPDASIGGDLKYSGPAELAFPAGAVKGSTTFKRPVSDYKPKFSIPRGFGAFLWIFEFIAAIIAGSVIVALTKDHARRTANIIRTKPLKSLGIGFIAYICIPIIVLIALVMLVTAPLSIMLLLAYLIALYIAKFYVAIWLGNLMLRRGGRTDVSPLPAMLLGLLVVYVITAIPGVGTIIGIIIIFLGIGALLQRKETRLNGVFESPPSPSQGLPDAFPGGPRPPVAPGPPAPQAKEG